jgi:hypothetical protein
VHLIDTVTQCFRTHRLYQLLNWIDALSRGYEAPDNRRRPADDALIGDSHRPPTVSNLAYYLITDADYNKDTLEEKFSFLALRGTPDKEVFTYVKRDLTRHLAQYPGDLLMTKSVKKGSGNHPTFDVGLESRRVEAKAYYLTTHGQNRLAELSDLIQFKRNLITSLQTGNSQQGPVKFVKEKDVLTDDAIERIHEPVDTDAIETDSITILVEDRWEWKTATYTLPHVAVVDAARSQPPTVYRK